MAWVALFIAGLLETAWATCLKSIADRFSISLLITTVALMFASLATLYWSMRSLPLGIAYPIWTGIGSVGSVIASVILFKPQFGIVGISGVTCLIVGMYRVSRETH